MATRRAPAKATKKAAPAKKAAARKATGGSRAEQQRICNLVPSKDTETDWGFAAALESGALGAVTALPPNVDLRAAWWAIDNQENTGSCVGWATAEGVLRYHMVQASKLGQNEPLSARYVWMGSKEIDSFTSRPQTFIEEAGTSLKAAVDVARKYGTVTEAALPFHIATKMYTGNENSFYATAASRKIAAYFNLRKDVNQWKSWLAGHGPILAGLSVDATWDNAAATGGKLDKFQPTTVRGGHAIAVVGYRTDGRFIIRNSWGTAWGDKGFGYASAAYIAGAFFDESYGVTL